MQSMASGPTMMGAQPKYVSGPGGGGQEMWRYQPPDGIGVRIRSEPLINGPTSGEIMEPGTAFAVAESRRGEDGILYLRLADGRGWMFDTKPGFGVMCVKDQAISSMSKPMQKGNDERANLLATLRNQDVELGKLVPQVQQLRANYSTHHRDFVQRVDHLEAKLMACHLVPEGVEHHEHTPQHLQNALRKDQLDKEMAAEKEKKDKENAAKQEDAEAHLAEEFLSDVSWLLPGKKAHHRRPHAPFQKHQGPHDGPSTPSATPMMDHAYSESDKKIPWDPTLPPGAKVVDIRVWEDEPGPRSYSAYASHNATCILAPEAKDEDLRMRFRAAAGESMGAHSDYHKAPMRKAVVEDSHALLESLPHWHAGPFRNVLGQCKNLFYVPRPPPAICGEHLYWTPYGDYIEDRQPAYGTRQGVYSAPADFYQSREYPGSKGSVVGVEVLERLEGYQTTVPVLDYTYRRQLEVPDV